MSAERCPQFVHESFVIVDRLAGRDIACPAQQIGPRRKCVRMSWDKSFPLLNHRDDDFQGLDLLLLPPAPASSGPTLP
jgi:hypothetical protein